MSLGYRKSVDEANCERQKVKLLPHFEKQIVICENSISARLVSGRPKSKGIKISKKDLKFNAFCPQKIDTSKGIKDDFKRMAKTGDFNINIRNQAQRQTVEFDPAVHSILSYGVNEDKISVVVNPVCPDGVASENWPSICFFGLYDGHGGSDCSEFLKNNLHHYILTDPEFVQNPKEAIIKGFKRAENEYLNMVKMSIDIYKNKEDITITRKGSIRSGSCAVIAICINNKCYIANVGDSRALLSFKFGFKQVTIDHKPESKEEFIRIKQNGGKVYKSRSRSRHQDSISTQESNQPSCVYRIMPGKLSVSRSIGDFKAKTQRFGGNDKVLIATPNIQSFEINENLNFILLATDGLFETLSNNDIIDHISQTTEKLSAKAKNNFHLFIGDLSTSLLKESIDKNSMDNISCAVIAFKNFSKCKIYSRRELENQNKIEEKLKSAAFKYFSKSKLKQQSKPNHLASSEGNIKLQEIINDSRKSRDKNYVNTQIKRKRHNGCLFASEYKFENIVTKNITFDGRRRNSKDIINN